MDYKKITMAAPKKKKKRKIKYKKFEFKLSEKQKKIIDKFCRAKKVSPNKMIKTAIRDYISKFADSLPEEDYISENQLQLFDVEEEQEIFNSVPQENEFKETLFWQIVALCFIGKNIDKVWHWKRIKALWKRKGVHTWRMDRQTSRKLMKTYSLM